MTTANANDHRHTTCKFCSRTQCFIKKCWTSAGHCKCYSTGGTRTNLYGMDC